MILDLGGWRQLLYEIDAVFAVRLRFVAFGGVSDDLVVVGAEVPTVLAGFVCEDLELGD